MISLTATELPRFMVCNGYLFLDKIEPTDTNLTAANEGSTVHWMIEQLFNKTYTFENIEGVKTPTGMFVTSEMIAHVSDYFNVIKDKGEVEYNTSLTNDVWEIRGRCDHLFHSGQTLYINEFKYGYRIVEPENNWTLIWHAIGYCSKLNPQNLPTDIVFTVFQPRAYHPLGEQREWSITYQELMELYTRLDNSLRNPSKQCVSSNHCYKCKSITFCQANQIAMMNSIDVAEKAYNSKVTNKELSFLLDELKRAKNVLKESYNAYNDLALSRIKMGETIPNYSGTTKLSNTKWKEGITPEIAIQLLGENCCKKQLLTPKQAVKAGVSEEVVKSLTERNPTGIKLIRMDGSKQAEKLFGRKQ